MHIASCDSQVQQGAPGLTISPRCEGDPCRMHGAMVWHVLHWSLHSLRHLYCTDHCGGCCSLPRRCWWGINVPHLASATGRQQHHARPWQHSAAASSLCCLQATMRSGWRTCLHCSCWLSMPTSVAVILQGLRALA